MRRLLVCLLLAGMTGTAAQAAEYYFLGYAPGDKRPMWTSMGECRGDGCGEIGACDGVTYYAAESTYEYAVYMLNQGDSILIRESWAPFTHVCTWEP